MKSTFAKLAILLMAILCLSCSKEDTSVVFTYSTISNTFQTIRVMLCANHGTASVTIPTTADISGTIDTVAAISGNAFSNCYGLVSVNIPATVTSIASNAFYGCNTLTSINVDSNDSCYSSISGVLFNKQATTLVEFPAGISGSYTIPSSVTAIETVAFQECNKLTSVTIPSSVTTIGSFAFYNCSGITAIHIKNANPSNITLGSSVFYFPSTCKLYVPSGTKSLYAAATQWKTFSEIVEE